MSSKKVIFLSFVFFAVIQPGCSRQEQTVQNPPALSQLEESGPQTIKVDREAYPVVVYVSAGSGSDAKGRGSAAEPYQTLTVALKTIRDASAEKRYAVCVSAGEYSEETLRMKSWVDLYGGFSADWQKRDIWEYQSILSGQGKRRVLYGADDARLDGFFLQKGKVRGHGAALICDGVSPLITNNVFLHNRTLKPVPWNPVYWHETANDGGAVYCINGSSAVFNFNLFVENATENGRGAGIAFHDRCKVVLTNNVFIDNTAGLDDPMRSSDGGAVSIFDHCQARLESNVFLGNKALTFNDGGAVFIALWSSARVTGNLFVDNEAGDDAGALFVGGQEHRYDAPLDQIPSGEEFFVSIGQNVFIGNRNRSRNSGAMRFTMESRGEFTKNYTAFNNGVYFQRSEVLITENIFLDPVLVTETKEGLNKSVLRDNIFYAGLDLRTEVNMKNNRIRTRRQGVEKATPWLSQKSAGRELIAPSATYYRKRFITTITFPDLDAAAGELHNRVIRTANRWTVVKSNQADEITLWGDFSDQTVFTLLPVYQKAEE